MIIYHFIWDLVYLYQIEIPWYQTAAAYVWQQLISWTFIFLSGFCVLLGSKSMKRGIQVSIGGIIITITTLLFLKEQAVVFGILTFLGFAMIVVSLLRKYIVKIPPIQGFLGSFILFFLFRNCNRGTLGFETLTIMKLPKELYDGYVMSFLGFPDPQFSSTDYFSFFPWIFLYMMGVYFYQYIIVKEKRKLWMQPAIPWIAWVGKYSFYIYLVHQPVLYLILTVVFM
jgi:uncharacterized membrane protein